MRVLSIEPGRAWKSWRVFEFSRYGEETAMPGQVRRQVLEDFPTLEAAVIAYPDAQVMDPREVRGGPKE